VRDETHVLCGRGPRTPLPQELIGEPDPAVCAAGGRVRTGSPKSLPEDEYHTVDRIKVIKRLMFGRARFDLPRKRIL
jgi:hypothetical protein